MYNSFEDLFIAINKHIDSQNYAVIKCSLKKFEKNKLICKKTLKCDQEDKYIKIINNAHKKC